MEFSKERLKDSNLLPKRFTNSELRTGILLPLIVKNYSKLKHDVIYYASAVNCACKWTYKLVITNGTLFAFMSTSANVKSPAFAIYKANGGHVINHWIKQYRNLYISEFCNKAIMNPENNYLFDDWLVIEFKYEVEEFQSTYYYTNYGSLKSTKDTAELCENLKDMYLENCCTDLKIQVRDETFWAHKAVLATRAKSFANLFKKYQPSCNKTTCIAIDEIPRCFHIALIYIYSGELHCIDLEDFLVVYEIAHKLQIDGLEKAITYIMETHFSRLKAQRILLKSVTSELKNLTQFVVGCIKKNFPEMLDASKFEETFKANFSPSNVEILLDVAVKFELKNVISSAVDYINRNCPDMFDTPEFEEIFEENFSLSNIKFILNLAVKFKLKNLLNCAEDYIKMNCPEM